MYSQDVWRKKCYIYKHLVLEAIFEHYSKEKWRIFSGHCPVSFCFVATGWVWCKCNASSSGQTLRSDSKMTSCSSCRESYIFIIASGLTPFLLPRGRKEGRKGVWVKGIAMCCRSESLPLGSQSLYGRGQSHLYLILKKLLCFLALCVDPPRVLFLY